MGSRFDSVFENCATPSINRIFGVTAVYVRGTERFNLTDVLVDDTSSQIETADGYAVVSGLRTFLVSQTGPPFAGEYSEPQQGDRIIQCINGVDRVFRMLDEQGLPFFVSAGVGDNRFRVYTKEVSA